MSRTIGNPIRQIPHGELKRYHFPSTSKELTHLDEMARLKSEFISMASHELHTPLTSILGFSELLLNPEQHGGITPDRQKEFLEIIHKKAQDLMKIVDVILYLNHSRTGSGISLTKETCSIETLVTEALAALPKGADKKRIEVHLGEDGTSIWDRRKMGRALMALLDNALKFAPDSAVRIRGERSGENCLITVEDDGMGMTPKDLKKIFQPFFRVDVSLTAVPGFGVGLPFAKSIIEAHGGDLSVKSIPGVGTTVIVSVPLRECQTLPLP